ncbi:unnamed protein product [Fraxinus pennsylvanica]|uniref:Protein SCAR n=1 Tax=Fraxinus pennsylvanica TaxID=56036 RepID=A0AAD2E841_9LAMI|nr:unnamed protein product [Fraxinus pennsylvanica]
MPMIRYEIRNEHNLADPEVYRAADKDDPEALLEGVAMVGLVGVLRQLGDLAEFAAAIFHDLHEEVMATASRGHILMIRVEQLEAEIPSIEKLFFFQTDHSSLLYNGGVDLHPNLQMDQNLITQGDLPRFIMDSYEECRGPPRLFLLDKFDVAGSGACLKRYTDPSFFGVETSSGMTKAYVQREKRTHKANRKELNGRNGETSEVVPTSHAKLHQLFLKESVTNSISNPARHVKLKRRLNGVPFDSKNGKHYMEKLLRNPSPEHNVVHEVSVRSSLLKLPTHDHNESGVEVLEVVPLSPNMGRKSSPSSPNTEKILLKPSVYESIEVSTDDSLIQVSKSITSFEAVDISCAFDLVTSEEDITVDGESKEEGSLNGYHSDDVSTEIDYYVDAPSTIESDVYTDSEWRGKSDFTSSNTKKQLYISNTDDEYLQTHSSDSQSIGHSSILDEGNNSYKKETSNFSSDSPRTSTENTLLEDLDSVEVFSPADITEIVFNGMPSYQKPANENISVPEHSKPAVSDEAEITSHRPDFGELSSCSCPIIPSPTDCDAEAFAGEGRFMGPNSDEIPSNESANKSIDTEENWTKLVNNLPFSPSVYDVTLSTRDYFSSSSAGNHLVDESNVGNLVMGESVSCIYTVSDVPSHTRDNSVEMSEFLLKDASDKDIENLSIDIDSTFNISNIISHSKVNNPQMMFSDIPVPNELDFEVPKLPENCMSDHLDSPQKEDSSIPILFEQKQLYYELNNEDQNLVYDASNHFSCIVDPTPGKEIEETPLGSMLQTVGADHYSKNSVDHQVNSPNMISSNIKEHFLDHPRAGLHSHNTDDDAIFTKEMALSGTSIVGCPKSSDIGRSQGTGILDVYSSIDSAEVESSCCIQDNIEKPTIRSDSVEMDGITCCMDSTGNKETDIISPNDVHVRFVEIDPETNQYDAVDVATVVTGSAVNADENDVLSVGHMLKEGCIPFYGDLSHDDFRTDENWHPYSHGESILVEEEEVDQLEVATSHLDSVDTVPNSCMPLEVENSLNLVNTTIIKLSLEKRGLYTEQESEQKSSLPSRTEDASYLPINPQTEETILQETIGLLPNTLDPEFPEAGETDLELLPTSKSMQKFDHNDHQGCNNSTYTFSDLPRQGNYENDFFGHPKNLSSSIFPLINLHSETIQINLEESPPLPPLPPLQWRIGKLINTYRATEKETEQHNVSSLSSVLPMGADEKAQSFIPNLPLSAVIKKDSPSVDDEMTQDCFLAGEGKIMLPALKSSSSGISLDSPSADDVGSSFEELNQSPHQVAAEITSKEDKAEYNSSSLQSNIMKHETVELLPMKDNGIENGSRTTKLPRPRNPLIDAVVAHDKSKLRKVTERVRPQMQSVDEKGSFLEQIRTKSFNLKPAVMAKPSIQGPNTNLKVAALLEKAKTIRQALAGSDEDDEDSWSDS